MVLLGEDQILESVLGRLQDVTRYLYTGLEDVYSQEDRKVIKNVREVLDLEGLLQLTKEMSPAVVSQRKVGKFIEAAKELDEDFNVKYEKQEFRYQYRDFVDQIAKLGKEENSEKLSSIEIMVKMMSTKCRKWRGCEAIMDILCQAAVKKTVEAVVESWVSVLEHHSSKTRNLKAETIQSEMMVAVNGPLVQHSMGVVEESMKVYWGRLKNNLSDGHFTRRSNKVKSFTVSKSVDSLNSVPVKTPFVT